VISDQLSVIKSIRHSRNLRNRRSWLTNFEVQGIREAIYPLAPELCIDHSPLIALDRGCGQNAPQGSAGDSSKAQELRFGVLPSSADVGDCCRQRINSKPSASARSSNSLLLIPPSHFDHS
jgi:hypothetical protein